MLLGLGADAIIDSRVKFKLGVYLMPFDITTAPRIRFLPNWKPPKSSRPSYLIRGLGGDLREFAAEIGAAVTDAKIPSSRLGVAANKPRGDAETTLRFVQSLQGVHRSMVDISLTTRSTDLFVRVSCETRSWLKHLHRGLVGSLSAVIFLVLTWFFLNMTGAFEEIQFEWYRHKHPNAAQEAYGAFRDGTQYNPETGLMTRIQPASFGTILRETPRIVFFHLSTPCAMIVGIAGVTSYIVARMLFDDLCRLVGWPTPRVFEDFAAANESWMFGLMNRVLQDRGIGEQDIIAC